MSLEPGGPFSDWRQTVFGRRQPAGDDSPEPNGSPGRRFAIAAFVALVASQTTRWGWWTDFLGHTSDVGFVGQSVAGLGGSLAALLLYLTIRARSGASSGFRLVQLLPLALGVACLLIAVGGVQQAYTEMSGHQSQGRPAGMDLGAWLALAGGLTAAVGGILGTASRLRNPVHGDAEWPWSRGPRVVPGSEVHLERLRERGRTR